MTHYIGVVASLAIRRSPASTQPANLLLVPARAPRIGAPGIVNNCIARYLSYDATVTSSNPTRVSKSG